MLSSKKNKIITFVAAITLIGASVLAADIVKTRKGHMEMLKDAMKTINGVVESGGPAGNAAAPAQQIAEIARKIPDLFPQGSDQGDTTAKPEIWQDWDKFTVRAQETEKVALAVLAAANSGDAAQLGSSFKALGGTCGSCHQDFKAKK